MDDFVCGQEFGGGERRRVLGWASERRVGGLMGGQGGGTWFVRRTSSCVFLAAPRKIPPPF